MRPKRALVGVGFIALIGTFLPTALDLYTDEFTSPARADVVATPAEPSADQIAAAQERECLAEALYYEARGEGESGEKAVAEVVMARLKSPDYPKTICGVVLEGTDHPGKHCQFSFACDGSTHHAKEEVAWDRARTLATRILGGAVKLGGQTGHAIAYHSIDVTPDWADDMLRTAQIGNHIFYRRLPLGARLSIPVAAAEPDASQSTTDNETRSDEVQPDVLIAGAVGDGT